MPNNYVLKTIPSTTKLVSMSKLYTLRLICGVARKFFPQAKEFLPKVKNVLPEFCAICATRIFPLASLSSQPITRYRGKGGSAMSARIIPKFNSDALDDERYKSPAQCIH